MVYPIILSSHIILLVLLRIHYVVHGVSKTKNHVFYDYNMMSDCISTGVPRSLLVAFFSS